MIMTESNIDFEFDEKYSVIKLDDTTFYRNEFERFPSGKAVDFLAVSNEQILLVEVKNCKGHEVENRYRTVTNGKTDEETFDVEVAKKVSSTLSCIAAAFTHPDNQSDAAAEIIDLFKNKPVENGKYRVYVFLFLEGDFEKSTRDKNMIMHRLRARLKTFLKSIYSCRIYVVDSDAEGQFNKYFSIKIPSTNT